MTESSPEPRAERRKQFDRVESALLIDNAIRLVKNPDATYEEMDRKLPKVRTW